MARRKAYPHDLKVGAARAVVEEGKARPEVMGALGPKPKTQLGAWCRLYREGGIMRKERGYVSSPVA